jgi:hypothetical protein
MATEGKAGKVSHHVELQVRGMTKAQRHEYLLDHGWRNLDSRGAGCWVRFTRGSKEDVVFYTQAQAIRTALAEEPISDEAT